MPLDPAIRRSLAAQANRLKATLTVAADLSPAAIAHVRQALAAGGLVKVRINTAHSAECDAIARQFAAEVPCELIKRIGYVAILYREPPAAENHQPEQ